MSQIPSFQSPSMGPGPLQPHRGTMILVFGILSFVVCVIFGIVAWVMGNNDLRAMDEGRMDPEGRGLTQAGRICGMVSTILLLAGILLWVVLFVFLSVFGAAASSGAGGP